MHFYAPVIIVIFDFAMGSVPPPMPPKFLWIGVCA